MDELRDGEMIEVRVPPLLVPFAPLFVSTLLCSVHRFILSSHLQEDPIADAYCTVPAFRWKKMFYPEIKMPYMPISEEKQDPKRGITMESMELEEMELAMVSFAFFPKLFFPLLRLKCAHARLVDGVTHTQTYTHIHSHTHTHTHSRWRKKRQRRKQRGSTAGLQRGRRSERTNAG
jgi:hypothetical protein